ncbi:MAG TPA: flavodoxin family protein [Methanocorpusculum sp.]|nr:flavodoxin family protein [Methanocorpusculum sp.]
MADVVLISGSPRANGNTEYALNICKEEIEKHGLTAEIISLRGKQIHGCIACGKCGTQDCCALQDDLNEMLPAIKEAKGFIIGAPVYFGTARGDVMNLLRGSAWSPERTETGLQEKLEVRLLLHAEADLHPPYRRCLCPSSSPE